MGGLGPGIGGGEWLVLGIVALLVVGPERLPGLLRELGKWVAKARGMANEFRSSFDEMARQTELDDLRKEVEALRTHNPVNLGADADAAFKDIKSEFDKPLFDPVMTPAPTEWPVDTGSIEPVASEPVEETGLPAKPRAKRARVAAKPKVGVKPKAEAKPKTGTKSKAGTKPKAGARPKAAARPKAVAKSKAVDL